MVFTASGSEANNLAIRGAALAHDRAAPAQIITQASEHPAVLETCRALQRLHGVQVRYLPVDQDGRIDPTALAKALTPDTVLVSIMAANNETVCCSPSPNWRPSPMPATSSSTPTPPRRLGRFPSTSEPGASICSPSPVTRCTRPRASAPCMSVPVCGWSLSSMAVGKNADCARNRKRRPGRRARRRRTHRSYRTRRRWRRPDPHFAGHVAPPTR